MQIRTAIESDYKPLMKLYNAFVGSDRYSGYDNDSFQKVIKNPQNYVFVAEEDNILIGFVTFSIRNVIRYPKQIAELDELYVDTNHRKKGIGKLFMRAVEEKAKDLNCYRLYIESHYDHKGAHVFYESLGYTNYGYHFIKNL